MSLIGINADLPNLDRVLKAVEKGSRGDLPYTKEAIHSATIDVIQRTWIEYASGATVTYSGGTFKINVVSGEYVRSIQDGVRFLEDLTGEVFSTSPHGAIVEEGQRAHDMKPALLSSPKAKHGKGGSTYITVPFRHGTPNTTGLAPMPNHVYNQAKNLAYSRKNGFLKTMWTGKSYTWGGKLGKSSEGQRSHIEPHRGAGYTWKTGMYSGMVKMGKEGHSQYMTFRRVSSNSAPNSWQYPDVPPRPIREAVVENTKEEVLQLIRNGFSMDLYFMGLGGDS